MSYNQGWRRGSPYERPGNYGYNDRRGKMRKPQGPVQGSRPMNDSPASSRPSPSQPTQTTPVKSENAQPVAADKKVIVPPKTDVKNKAETSPVADTNLKQPTTVVKSDPGKPVTSAGVSETSTTVSNGTKSVSGTESGKSATTESEPSKSQPKDTTPSKSNAGAADKTPKEVAPIKTEVAKTPQAPVNNKKPIAETKSVTTPRVNESSAQGRDNKDKDKKTTLQPVTHTSGTSPTPAKLMKHESGRSEPSRQDSNRHDRNRGDNSRYESDKHETGRNDPSKPYSGWVDRSQLKQEEMETDSVPQEKLININDLIRPSEKKFSARCRLFVAGLPNGCSEEDFCKLFEPYGETTEAYINKDKGFGFIRMDYRVNSEIARNKLDGSNFKGRRLQVRFASNASAIEVHGLGPFVTDEVLEQAFLKFGSVERATVVCDDRGKSKEYGIVEFSYKKSTQKALQAVTSGLYVLGRAPKPVSAKLLVTVDEESGVKEADIERRAGYTEEREFKPRFVNPGSYEYELAQKWKSLDETENARKQEIENEIKLAREELENDIANAMHLREEELMREELRKKEEELRQLEELKQMEHMRLQEQLRRLEQKRMEDDQRRQEDLNRKQSELRAQGEMRKIQDLHRQDDFRRRGDLGRRPDDIRNKEGDRRPGDIRPGDMRPRDDDHRRSDEGRIPGHGGVRGGDINLRRMDDVKRKDNFRGDNDYRKDSKLDMQRGPPGRGQQDDRGARNPLDTNMPPLQPPPPLPALMTQGRASGDPSHKFPGMMGSDFRNVSPGMGGSGASSNVNQPGIDSMRNFNPGQLPFPRGPDLGRQGYPNSGGPGGFDSPGGRMPFSEPNLIQGLSPGEMPSSAIGGGILPNQPRMPPPPAVPGSLAKKGFIRW